MAIPQSPLKPFGRSFNDIRFNSEEISNLNSPQRAPDMTNKINANAIKTPIGWIPNYLIRGASRFLVLVFRIAITITLVTIATLILYLAVGFVGANGNVTDPVKPGSPNARFASQPEAPVTASATVNAPLVPSKTDQPYERTSHEMFLNASISLLALARVIAAMYGSWLHISRYCIKSCPGHGGGGSSSNWRAGGSRRQGAAGGGWAPHSPAPNDGNYAGNNRNFSRNNNSRDGNGGNNGDGINNNDSNSNASREKHSFACPFFVLNPMMYEDCTKYKLSRLPDVMQHFQRHHCIDVDFYCPDCYVAFHTIEDQDAHIRAKLCQPQQGPDNFYRSEIKWLKENVKSLKVQAGDTRSDEVMKWEWMWRRCFRNDPVPPSPYMDSHMRRYAGIMREKNELAIREKLCRMLQELQITDIRYIDGWLDEIATAAYDTTEDPVVLWCFRDSTTNPGSADLGAGNTNANLNAASDHLLHDDDHSAFASTAQFGPAQAHVSSDIAMFDSAHELGSNVAWSSFTDYPPWTGPGN